MSPLLQNAPRTAHWDVEVYGRPSGELSLYETPVGYVWNWSGKPSHLIPLVGVLEDDAIETKRAFRFGELDAAVSHVMHCSGIAYKGQCALVDAH